MIPIEFNDDWNGKIYHDTFTTIRLRSKKYEVGKSYEIHYKKYLLGIAKALDIKYFTLDQLPNITAHLDTGYNKEKTQEIIKTLYQNLYIDWQNKTLCIVLLEYTTKLFKNEVTLNIGNKQVKLLSK